MSIIAIMLSVGVMVVSVSMVNGFTSEIQNKLFGFWGHIHIDHLDNNQTFDETPISKNQQFVDDIDTIKSIESIHAYAYKPGIIKTKDNIEGIIIKGLGTDYDWTFIQSFIKEGEVLQLKEGETIRELMISETTAKRLNLEVDSKVIIYFMRTEVADRIGRAFQVKGIFNTGLEEYDKQFVLADINVIRELNGWSEDQIGGFEVKLKDVSQLLEMDEFIYKDLIGPELKTETIMESNPNIFEWLRLQKFNEFIILLLMLVVAILNMITALLILILDRTKMIGTLKALGANNGFIRRVFIYNAMYIITWGIILGNVVGLGLCLIQKYFHIIKLPEDSYYVTVAPVKINLLHIAGINLATIAICTLVLLLPAMLISRISPVKAIRFE